MRAGIFASCAKILTLKGAVKFSAALIYNNLSNLTSLGLLLLSHLLLLTGGSDTDRDGTRSAEGFDGGLVGLAISYYLRYDFPDRVPLTGVWIFHKNDLFF